MPYQRVIRTYKIFFNKRGLYNIGDVAIEVGDFVGFKAERKILPMDSEIVVLPERIDLKDTITPLGSLSGDISVKRWIIDDPLMTVGIRSAQEMNQSDLLYTN